MLPNKKKETNSTQSCVINSKRWDQKKKLEQQEQWQFNKFIRLSNILSPTHTHTHTRAHTYTGIRILSTCTQHLTNHTFYIYIYTYVLRVMRKCFENFIFRFYFYFSNIKCIYNCVMCVCFNIPLLYIVSFHLFLLGRSLLLTHRHTHTSIHNDNVLWHPITIISKKSPILFNGKSTQ